LFQKRSCKERKAFPDVRAVPYTAEEATAKLDELDQADAIIFGCPTYMGSMSAGVKTFVETAARSGSPSLEGQGGGSLYQFLLFSGDKLNTLVGLVINAMQHGMIYVGLGMMPSANPPEGMQSIAGPGPGAQNRVGSFIGPMSASFQVHPPDAPVPGDLKTARLYGARVAAITTRPFKGRG